MVEVIRAWYRNRAGQPWVRPWGMAGPVLVLVACLPLLRPLRQPDLTEISGNELERLATVQAIVEHNTLAIDDASILVLAGRMPRLHGTGSPPAVHHYSKQPPVLAAVLAGPYWLMHRLGLTFDSNAALTTYLLTLLGATLPVALSAAIVYRMGRLFELSRPRRAILAAAAIFGSGLVSYATVLNSHAPAAALVLAGFGCFYHALTARRRQESLAWLIWAGLNVGLAAAMDLGALMFLALLVLVIFASHWPAASKVAAAGGYVLGAVPPLVLHAILTIPITGDIRPGFLHAELSSTVVQLPVDAAASEADLDDEQPGLLSIAAVRIAEGLLGPRGLLSHFPILLLGIAGISAVMHRHWPAATKMLAIVSVLAAALIIAAYAMLNADWDQPMFSVRWFVVFLPVLVFWAGAWLRKAHHPAAWASAAALLLFSIATTLLGATAPFTQARPGEYTAYAAARQLLHPAPSQGALVSAQWRTPGDADLGIRVQDR